MSSLIFPMSASWTARTSCSCRSEQTGPKGPSHRSHGSVESKNGRPVQGTFGFADVSVPLIVVFAVIGALLVVAFAVAIVLAYMSGQHGAVKPTEDKQSRDSQFLDIYWCCLVRLLSRPPSVQQDSCSPVLTHQKIARDSTI
jgi:hypothetical protein